jgi:hypothetical protein
MIQEERKAEEADRLLRETAPYLDALEAETIEAMISAQYSDECMEARRTVQTIRNFRRQFYQAIVLGKTAARKAPAVA